MGVIPVVLTGWFEGKFMRRSNVFWWLVWYVLSRTGSSDIRRGREVVRFGNWDQVLLTSGYAKHFDAISSLSS